MRFCIRGDVLAPALFGVLGLISIPACSTGSAMEGGNEAVGGHHHDSGVPDTDGVDEGAGGTDGVDGGAGGRDGVDACLHPLAPFPLFGRTAAEANGEYFQATREGDVLHFDGTRWERVELREPTVPGVWAASEDDVFVAGYTRLFHYDGRELDAEFSRATNAASFVGIWGFSGEDVWAAGNTEPGCADCSEPSTLDIFHHDGASWSRVPSELQGSASDIWGAAPDDVWLSGSSLWHFDGETWSEAPQPELGQTGRFLGKSQTSAYLTDGVTLFRFDASEWTEVNTGGYAISALAESATGELYARSSVEGQRVLLRQEGTSFVELPEAGVGEEFTLATFDGDVLALEATRISRIVDGQAEPWVTTFDAGLFEAEWSDGNGAIAALRGGALLRVDEQARVLADLGDDVSLYALDGSSIDDLWMVALLGLEERAFHWDGASLEPIALPGQESLSLTDVYVAPDGGAWAVGHAGPDTEASGPFLFRLDETNPTNLDVGERFESLYSVAGSGAQVYVADFAQVAMWEDGELSDLPDPGGEILDLSVAAEDDVYVIARSGDRADVLHWDGASWSTIDAIGGHPWRYASANGPADVWITGSESTGETFMAHYDGQEWSLVENLPDLGGVRPLRTSDDELLLAGYYESWRYECIP